MSQIIVGANLKRGVAIRRSWCNVERLIPSRDGSYGISTRRCGKQVEIKVRFYTKLEVHRAADHRENRPERLDRGLDAFLNEAVDFEEKSG